MATFSNQATLSYGGNTTNSNVVTGELLAVLSATKTAIGATYRPGDRITYIIRIVNTGTSPFSELTVTDNLGSYTFENRTLIPLTYVDNSLRYFLDGMPQPTPDVSPAPTLTASGIAVPAGGTAMLIYEAIVNTFAPPGTGSSITNTATITGCAITVPLEISETIFAAADASLVLSKSICPSAVAANGQLTYTFVIQNIGNSAAGTDQSAVITDTFDPILSDISVTYNGVPWTAPENYTYDPLCGLFTTGPSQITVPAATYTQNPATGGYIMTPGVATVQVTGTV